MIVRLCHQVLKLSKKPILVQLLVLFLSDSEIKNYQSELERWANSIKEEVNLLIGEEQGSGFRKLLVFSESESHRQRLNTHARVLDSCSTYDYQTTWKEIRNTRKCDFVQTVYRIPALENQSRVIHIGVYRQTGIRKVCSAGQHC